MDIAELKVLGDRWGFEAVDCAGCRDGMAAGNESPCPNCEGSGRVWRGRASTLSDSGLGRLREATPERVRRPTSAVANDDE
mgnify:CR=1 FL=1